MKALKHTITWKMQLLSALALFLSVLACGAAFGQITPSADSYTNTADTATNYGTKTLLDVDGATQITYIQFNLASIPSGASVSQATLKLYVNTVATAGSFNVDYVNGPWAESTIDASNAPPLGGAVASNVNVTTEDKNQYLLINVTSAVQAWLSGAETNNGIALVANSTFNATFDSKENTTTSHPAELDIVFGGIAGVATASGSGLTGGGTSGTLNLGLLTSCSSGQVLEWNGSAWACATTSGTGTITGVTAGTDLTGGGTGGNVTLNLNTAALNSAYAQLGAANTFAPQQVIKGNGGNAIIGDPGCGSGFSGIGLTSSTLSGCANYTMIGKSSGDVYVNSTSTGYIHFRNVNSGSDQYNDLATIDNMGNLTAAGKVVGTASNTGVSAVIGVVTATTGTSAGVLGETLSTAGYGVYGASPFVGVNGKSGSASETGAGSGQAGVWGDTGAPADSGNTGVRGTADDNFAGVFENNGPDVGALAAKNSSSASGSTVFETFGPNGGVGPMCIIDIDSNLTCNGEISGVVKADGGTRQVSVYAMQSPENWFEDFGSGVLTNGAMAVPLDPTFTSTVNTAIDYHVFLTPRGECEGLYVTNVTRSGFEVRELHHGSSNVAFDYRIVAKRAGYENQRLEDVTERYQKMREREEKLRQQTQRRRAARAVAASIAPRATGAIEPTSPPRSAAGAIPRYR
jgi:TGF-beta propeptide